MRGLLATLLLLPGLAMAAPPGVEHVGGEGDVQIDLRYSPDYQRCMASNDTGSDMTMVECMTAESNRWDRRLNAAYGKLRSGLDRETFGEVQKAQRAWVAFRQADCAATENVVARGGTMGRVAANSCFLMHTAMRVRELEQMLAQSEGR